MWWSRSMMFDVRTYDTSIYFLGQRKKCQSSSAQNQGAIYIVKLYKKKQSRITFTYKSVQSQLLVLYIGINGWLAVALCKTCYILVYIYIDTIDPMSHLRFLSIMCDCALGTWRHTYLIRDVDTFVFMNKNRIHHSMQPIRSDDRDYFKFIQIRLNLLVYIVARVNRIFVHKDGYDDDVSYIC